MRICLHSIALASFDRIRHRARVRRERRKAVRLAERVEARPKVWTRAEVLGLFLVWELPRGFNLALSIYPGSDRILASIRWPQGCTSVAVVHICDSCLSGDGWPKIVAEVRRQLEAEAGISPEADFAFRVSSPSAN